MICERNMVQEIEIVFVIERAPAAVFILHADEPCKSSADRSAQAGRFRIFHATQRHQNECRVVHVRIKIISELECPSARFRIAILYLPIARPENLVVHSQREAASSAGCAGSSPASSSETIAMAVSHKGEMQGWTRSVSASSIS